MNRRRITLCTNTQKTETESKLKQRHSHLNQNQHLKQAFQVKFNEEDNTSVQNKQKIHLLNKSLKSIKSRYLLEENNKEAPEKIFIDKKQLGKKIAFTQQKKLLFLKVKIKSQSLQNCFSQSNDSRNKQKPYFKQLNFAQNYHKNQFIQNIFSTELKKEIKNKNNFQFNNIDFSKTFTSSLNIKNFKNRQQKLLIDRQNKQNHSALHKRSVSTQVQQKPNQQKKKLRYNVKRLWQIEAIKQKREQNEMVQNFILQEIVPSVKTFKSFSFNIPSDSDEVSDGQKLKGQKNSLNRYGKVLKSLNQINPPYGLKKRAMSLTKLKIMKKQNKNLFRIY